MKKIWDALWIPLMGVILIAVIFFMEHQEVVQWRQWGIRPREWKGLVGIISSPFLHGSKEHLFNNSIPLLVLGWSLFYFYRELAWRTIAWIVILGGSWVWLSAREGTNHIGASGLIYGLVTFLFFSGILRKYKPLIAISLFVVFQYGSMVWGILPVQEHISWEGHLWGALAGVLMAYYYRPEGPQRPKFDWEDEPDDEDDELGPWNQFKENEVTLSQNARPVKVIYHVKRRSNPSPPSSSSSDRPPEGGAGKLPEGGN